MATIFRGPVVFRVWQKQPWAVSVGSQDWVWARPLNVALLVGKDTFFRTAGYAPNYDYPNPTLPKSRIVAQSAQDWIISARNNNLLIKQDVIWAARGQVIDYDWTNPVWPKPRYVAVTSQDGVWQERNNNLLIKQDRVFGGPGQTHPYDWTNPVIPKSRLVSQSAQDWIGPDRNNNLLIKQDVIWGAVGQVVDYDWQNPNRIRDERGVSIRAQSEQVNLSLTTLYTNLFRKPLIIRITRVPGSEWAAIESQIRVWQNRLNLLGQDLLPNNQKDWPNPLRPGPRQSESRDDQLLTKLQGLDVFPANQKDWPNPNRGLSSHESPAPSNLLPVLLSVSSSPFVELDWLNPLRSSRSITIYDVTVTLPSFFPPPTPPSAEIIEPTYFVCNVGRMMHRRGGA